MLQHTNKALKGFPSAIRVSYDASNAISTLSRGLDSALQSHKGEDVVVVCVGTDRSTGDAFGPIIGSRLTRVLANERIFVYGTLENPVHAVNLKAKLEDIQYFHRNRPHVVLAVDACLGKFDHVGQIVLEEGPLRPGAGVNKELPEFGQYTLTGIVNVSGFMEYFVLQNTRLGIVMKMTDVVVHALVTSLRSLELDEDFNEVRGIK